MTDKQIAEKIREACAQECEGLREGAEMAMHLDFPWNERVEIREDFARWVDALNKMAQAIRALDIDEVLNAKDTRQ